jgi:hypothetical protein
LLGIAFVLAACVATPYSRKPVEEGQFVLSIESKRDDDQQLLLRLHNNSNSTVCVSGQSELWVSGSLERKVTTSHRSCDVDLPLLKPGDTVQWLEPWSSNECWPGVPATIEARRPALRCGTAIDIQVRVELLVTEFRGEAHWISSNRVSTVTRPASSLK